MNYTISSYTAVISSCTFYTLGEGVEGIHTIVHFYALGEGTEGIHTIVHFHTLGEGMEGFHTILHMFCINSTYIIN